MRILNRGVGETLAVAGNAIVRVLKVRGEGVQAAGDTPKEKPVYRNEVLEELSAAAREALRPPNSPDGG